MTWDEGRGTRDEGRRRPTGPAERAHRPEAASFSVRISRHSRSRPAWDVLVQLHLSRATSQSCNPSRGKWERRHDDRGRRAAESPLLTNGPQRPLPWSRHLQCGEDCAARGALQPATGLDARKGQTLRGAWADARKGPTLRAPLGLSHLDGFYTGQGTPDSGLPASTDAERRGGVEHRVASACPSPTRLRGDPPWIDSELSTGLAGIAMCHVKHPLRRASGSRAQRVLLRTMARSSGINVATGSPRDHAAR